MEKEFVTYELAVKLKKLGFDEPCFAFYQLEYGEIRPIMVDDDEQYRLTGYRTCKNSEIPKHYTSAPTFSQTFRWFRKNHGLSAIVSQFGYSIENEFGGIEYYIDEDENPTFYEEAELACLTKLIELVESKSE